MKNLFSFLICLVLIVSSVSCENEKQSAKPEKVENTLTEIEREYERANSSLDWDSEKIALISILKNIPIDKSREILSDYKVKTNRLYFNVNESHYHKILDSIARKHGLPLNKVADFIFSFNYEMITSDEVVEDFIDSEGMYRQDYEYSDRY